MKPARPLRYASRCEDCGASLPAGALARLYKRRGRWVAYGADCHTQDAPAASTPHPLDPPGMTGPGTGVHPELAALAGKVDADTFAALVATYREIKARDAAPRAPLPGEPPAALVAPEPPAADPAAEAFIGGLL